MSEKKKTASGGRLCGTCFRPVAEHPVVGLGGPTWYERYCEMILVEDVKLPDGTIKTVKATNPNDPQRTKKNNKRYIHEDRFEKEFSGGKLDAETLEANPELVESTDSA